MRGRTIAVGALAFILFLAIFFTAFGPFVFEFPLGDMEGSWIGASVYAGLQRFAYGTQFVFTNGPLFPLYHRDYAGFASGWYVLGRLAVVVYLALGFSRLSATARPIGAAVAVVAFLLLWPVAPYAITDATLLIVPLLAVLLVLGRRGPWPLVAAGIVLAAAAGLAKISIIPFSIGAFVLADIALVARRRLPLATLVYAVASLALFVLAGQNWTDFVPFLVGSAEMAAGYSAALALDGQIYELLAWLAIWAFALVMLIRHEIGAVRAGSETRVDATVRVLLVAGFFYIALKAGFVRHDSHSTAAWSMLMFLLLLLGLPETLPNWKLRTAMTFFAVPLLGVVALFVLGTLNHYQGALVTTSARILAQEATDGFAFVTNPAAWLVTQDQLSAKANAEIRADRPLPALPGPVDTISDIQGAVLAAGLDYSPRPTVQENMTFSPALIARNRAFLDGASAPQTLLFTPGAPDGRHPASVEGSLWPLLLSRYAVSGWAGDQLILSRRSTPIAVASTAATSQTAFGTDIALPQTHAPIFLRLDIAETLLGKLADQAFKPPLVHLVERYADGSSETWRLIPGMIREGMLIAPTIKTIDEYETLAKGADLSGLRFPVSIRVETAGSWAYAPSIGVSLETLTIPAN